MPLSQLLNRSSRELHAELQLILNAVVEGLYGTDSQGNLTFCNDALLRMTGYRSEELIGKNIHDAIHYRRPDGAPYPELDCTLRKAIKAGHEIHVAGEVLWRKDGTCFPVEFWAHPLHHPSNPTVSVVTIQDISERELAIAALKASNEQFQQASAHIHQSEEKFRRILASMAEVAWTSDRERRTIYVSPKVESVLGYTKAEFCAAGGRGLRSGLIHPADFGRVNRGYQALFESQRPFDEEYRILRKDGTWIWIHDRASGTHEENGVLYADGFFSDITSRKQAEAELQSQRAFLEAQANSTIDGILVVGGNGQVLLHNERFVDLFKLPPELRAHQDDRSLLEYVVTLIRDPESFLAKVNHLYRHSSETGCDEIELKDGRVLDRYSAPVVDREGKYYGRIWTFRDITERKRNEDTLRQLSMAVEQSPALVVITDPDGDISYVNRKFTECTGYLPEDVLGKNPRLLNAGVSSPDLFRDLWSTITQGREWRGELCNRKKNGEIYWEAATIRPITDASGAIAHFLALKEDVTERRSADQALTASEKRYRQLFERNLAGVLRTTMDGRVLECNQAAARIFGYDSSEEALASSAPSAYHTTSDREAFLAKLKSEKNLTNHEMIFRRRDGDSVWVIANFSLLEDDARDGVIIEGTLIDITERKRAEEVVRESGEMVRILLDSIPAAVYGIDLYGNCTFCNPSCLQLLGYEDVSELLGKNMHDVMHHTREDGTHYSVEECHIYEAFRQGHGTHIDNEILWRRDGTSFAGEYWSRPMRRGGEIVGTVVTFVDITKRKLTEEELYESRQMLQSVLDAIPQRVFWKDRNSVYLGCNQAFATDGALDAPAAILGKSDFDLAWRASAETYRTDDQWVMERGSAKLNFEERQERPDGTVRWLQTNKLPLWDRDGKVTGVLGTYEDITERRELEWQLRQAQKLEGIGQLAAGIAHEINTPTQFVTDNLTFLRDSWKATQDLLHSYRSALHNSAAALPLDVVAAFEEAERACDLDFVVAEVPRAIDQSLDGARRVAEIVRAMKEFSHPDSADKTATDLNKAVASTITVARNEWKYVAEVVTHFDETLPAVVCYPGDVNQVILNLIVNAAHAIKDKVKDGEKGTITVGTRLRGEFAEISVTDTGTGVPEAVRTRIFDPFFTTKEVGKGTGQGLSLAHGVVTKKHAGKIWFETEMGRGTTFFINLPIKPGNRGKET